MSVDRGRVGMIVAALVAAAGAGTWAMRSRAAAPAAPAVPAAVVAARERMAQVPAPAAATRAATIIPIRPRSTLISTQT